MSLPKLIVVLAALASTLVLVSPASAGSWSLTTEYGTYVGSCKDNVYKNEGRLVCHAQLIPGSGPGVTGGSIKIAGDTYELTLTPSGRANYEEF